MNFINNINKYLLQRYPILWNTKIVWVTIVALFIHILSFIVGYFYYSNPRSLQTSYISGEYFTSGLLLVHLILSILILVIWLYKMFQNNAFKNYYPQSKNQLFGQFLQYVFIFLISITFYISHIYGVKTYISNTYSDKEFSEWKLKINKGAAFLSQNTEDYTLGNRKFPNIFSQLYCETNRDKMDLTQPYYKSYNRFYQYSTLVTDSLLRLEDEQSLYIDINYDDPKLAFTQTLDKYYLIFKKDKYVDMSEYIKSTELNYKNYSKVFYDYDRYNDGYGSVVIDSYDTENVSESTLKKQYQINKEIFEILERKDQAAIKKIMNDFLTISQELKISHNLSVNEWYGLVAQSEDFTVKKFIELTDPKKNYSHEYTEPAVEAASDGLYQEFSELELYFMKNKTEKYYEASSLNYALSSIDSLKNLDVFNQFFQTYLWIAIGFSLLVFSFRVTHLKAILFAGVSIGVLSLIVGLFGIMTAIVVPKSEIVILTFVLLLMSVIIFIPVLSKISGFKNFNAVLLVIAITGAPMFFFGILHYVDLLERSIMAKDFDHVYNYTTVIDQLSPSGFSMIVLVLTLVYIYLYTSIIMKWRAATE